VNEARLRINTENVVHEMIEGEVIVIDLGSGSYFSLSGSAPELWELLAGGVTVAEASAALRARYEGEVGEIDEKVGALFAQLAEVNLVVADPNGGGNGPVVAEQAATGDGNGKAPFVAPGFERYTDMQDYFLLDPIPEVSPEGWPKPAE
jgi:hypothetical protein